MFRRERLAPLRAAQRSRRREPRILDRFGRLLRRRQRPRGGVARDVDSLEADVGSHRRPPHARRAKRRGRPRWRVVAARGEIDMGVSNGQYPRDLRKVVAHAQRLMKVLSEIERYRKDAWFRGRAEEVRGAVSLAIEDWRSGARDADGAGRVLLSYVDSLHRGASKKLRCGLALACCDPDDVITAVAPDEWRSAATFNTTGAATSQVTAEATVPGEWVDTPEMLARFQKGLPLVEVHARSVARREGPGCTLDDLRAFGREGLLDAARSFNDSRGVPFDRWASLRIRNSMIDGVRRW